MRYLLIVLLALLALAAGVMRWQQDHIQRLADDVAKAQIQAVIAGFETSAARADVHVITQYVDRERVVRQVIHTIQRETPRYVTPRTDAAFPLPVGFVRLHDAAAAADLPGPPGAADAQASGVTASDAAVVIAGNYGTCHAIREQLNALIDRLQMPPYREAALDE
ncbi:hypothetical protein FHW84_003416 [Dyella sp. SG562]|uniref:hypothetical protein n=1 Tax=Dyella sp. SG562 TaxID=2587017 RepID=UPI0014245E9C|nr:hypothetical protein [Dyella sp. SG562]NII74820.1 hypothetical protein [Dyella sp. SG562]